MKNKIIVISILLAIVGVFAGLFFMLVYPYIPTYQWNVTMAIDDEEPYGAYYFYEALSKSTDDEKFVLIDESITNQLDTLENKGVYLFVGKYLYHDSLESVRLREFVERGNQAFFAVSNPDEGWNIISQITDSLIPCNSAIKFDRVSVTFDNDPLNKPYKFHYQWRHDTINYWWGYFDTCSMPLDSNLKFAGLPFNRGNITILSRFNGEFPDLISFPYGRGEVFLHANPIMFSNYYMINENGYNYANQCFETFSGKTIYWDEAGKKTRMAKSPEASIFKFIFTKPGLKWGWFVMLGAIALFLIFNSKRRQKVIPPMPEKQNTSAAFVKAIALLYRTNGGHEKIAAEMMQYFLHFVKLKYGISIKLNKTEEYIPQLVEMSGMDESIFRRIFNLNIQLEVSAESKNNRLKAFNENLENFYKNAK